MLIHTKTEHSSNRNLEKYGFQKLKCGQYSGLGQLVEFFCRQGNKVHIQKCIELKM